jgi:hypothetical protein
MPKFEFHESVTELPVCQEMNTLTDNFSHSIIGKYFQLTYEIILDLEYQVLNPKKYKLSIPLVLHAKPDLMQFSSKRVYLIEPDKVSRTYPDLVLPEPLFGKQFQPLLNDPVFMRDKPQFSISPFYNEIVETYELKGPLLC